jgi:hypothetical protein
MTKTNKEIRQRFLKYVNKTGKCWQWTGATRKGYGVFRWHHRVLGAHRVAFILWNGPIGDHDVVHHRCGNRGCVRPAHLQATTQADNLAEMLQRQQYLKAIQRLEKEVEKLKKELGQL